MPAFVIIRKSDGVEVCRYIADAPEPWKGWEFDTHDHVPLPEPEPEPTAPAPAGVTLTKLEYLRRFTAEERIAIRTVAKTNVVLEDYLALLELAEEVRTDDPDTVAAVQLLEAAGLLAAGRAVEVLTP